MPANLEYALLSANSYAETALDVSPNNEIPTPSSSAPWIIVRRADDEFTGFTARAYRNAAGEVVIAYAGTSNEGNLLQASRDWIFGNIAGGSGLTLPVQVVQAARFYLDVVASQPGAQVTFTGHSLGGGLASLMAVYFDQRAVTFDTAPFEKSADSSIVVNGLKAALLASGYTLPSSFASYVALDYLFGAVTPSPTRVAREGNVHSIYLEDEILSLLTVLFIAHQLPKGLAVDEVFALGAEKATQMRVVEEGQT